MVVAVSGFGGVGEPTAGLPDHGPTRSDQTGSNDAPQDDAPPDAPTGQTPASDSVPWQESTSAPLASSEPMPEPTVEFPAAASWAVELGAKGEPAARVDRGAGAPAARSADLPVSVAPRVTGVAGTRLDIKVLDRAAAERVGASGFVFQVSGLNNTGEPASTDLPTDLTVDYSRFADAYGGDYAARLQVVALPDCVAASRSHQGCSTAGVTLPVDNDLGGKTLRVRIDDLAALAAGSVESAPATAEDLGLPADDRADVRPPTEPSDDGAVTFAVMAGVEGDTGTYAASPLPETGEWAVSPGTGQFTWSYDIEVPEVPGGGAPTVSLGYSSAAVDGMTNGANPQGPGLGLGWSGIGDAYIERRYEPCYVAFKQGRGPLSTGDLCWKDDNAIISLDGISGPLLPINAERTEWRARSDPGWKIERGFDAPNADNNGEFWRVTAPDGTIYVFGRGIAPGRRTNSVATVPVVADHDTDPCWDQQNNAIADCRQAWRWSLDRVIDPNGNLQFNFYALERNHYVAIDGWGNIHKRYDRAIRLTEIAYGQRGWENKNYAARVSFGSQYRCTPLGASCPAPTRSNGDQFPDVPNDLLCRSSGCTVKTPSFFSARRYSHIRVEAWANGAWRPVVQHNLGHSFAIPTSGIQRKLLLNKIQHVGIARRGLLAYPVYDFDYAWKANRIDAEAGTIGVMRHARVYRIKHPLGANTTVAYGLNRACEANYRPTDGKWDRNVRDCFPQSVQSRNTQRFGLFNKWLVTAFTDNPRTDNAPNITTRYTYEGDPAWAFDLSAFARHEQFAGWTIWRGYGTTTVTQGSSKTRVRSFRGMHGDKMIVDAGGGRWDFGTREVSVESFDGSQSFPDHYVLAGRTLEEQEYGTVGGVADQVATSTLYEYEHRVTHDLGPDSIDTEWAGLRATTESIAQAPGQFRKRGGITTYNEHLQVERTRERGWLAVAGDERCSITTYAENADKWMFEYAATNVMVAGRCDSGQELSRTEILYDGSDTVGAPPIQGNPTTERVKLDDGSWATTTTAYDETGRVVSATDPNGATTTTTYIADRVNALPEQTVVTNELGHSVHTWFHVDIGRPRQEEDANGNITTYEYDALGRLTSVRLPTEQPDEAGKPPSWQFSYQISPDRSAPPIVRSRQLTTLATAEPEADFYDTWIVYDGLGRERQTHTPTFNNKVLVDVTAYDERGLVRVDTVPQPMDGTPGQGIIRVSPAVNATRFVYDELGRKIAERWTRDGEVTWETTTAYGADTVTVTGPEGHQVREKVDGLGRTVEVAERDGENWVATTYGYDLSDNLTSITDPAGNTITYAYDMAGRRVSQDDPDRGAASFTYDAVGNLTSVTDAKANPVHTIYDALGRKVERRAGSPTGELLARWEYDTAPGGVGKVHRTTSMLDAGAWIEEVTGYDARARALGTTTTVPATLPGLSGSYTASRTYDRADRVVSETLPAIGGLPVETITNRYNDLGFLWNIDGLEEYLHTVNYDDRGRPEWAWIGPDLRPGTGTVNHVQVVKGWQYDADQRLAKTLTWLRTADGEPPEVLASRQMFTYDNAGTLTERRVWLRGVGASEWRECYRHDQRRRLVEAFSVVPSDTCDTATPGTGDLPFHNRYGYQVDNRLRHRVDAVNAGWEDVMVYEYPAAGEDRPHAPTSIHPATGGTADTYTWDANGNLVERTVNGETETFTWDVQQQLASIQGPAGSTSFAYNADGNRIVRTNPDGSHTAYIAGHEVTANADGSAVSAVRAYSFNGQTIAVRTPARVDYLVSDRQGSVQMAVREGESEPSTHRLYEPYGETRHEQGDELSSDRGFLGEFEDESTNLSYLNARYYDPTTGLFISPDPLFDTGEPKTLSPYTYSLGNPTSRSDASGLSPSFERALEQQNTALRANNKALRKQNKSLIRTAKRLGGHIKDLQKVIKRQNKTIRRLVRHIRALEAQIRQMHKVIHQLQDRVRYLEGVVRWQARRISYLEGVVAYQTRVIRHQAGVISYYRGVVDKLGGRLWGTAYITRGIAASIHSGRGIPAGAFSYDRISALQRQVALWRSNFNDMVALKNAAVSGRLAAESERNVLRLKSDRLEDDVRSLGRRAERFEQSLERAREDLAHYKEMVDVTEMSVVDGECYYLTGSATVERDGVWDTIFSEVSSIVTGVVSGPVCAAMGN